jgi:hypothetical protein
MHPPRQALMVEVSEANDEQIARKRAAAEREREDDMRIAEYIRQRDAREQVGVLFSVFVRMQGRLGAK